MHHKMFISGALYKAWLEDSCNCAPDAFAFVDHGTASLRFAMDKLKKTPAFRCRKNLQYPALVKLLT